MDNIRTKTFFQRFLRNRRNTTEPTGNLWYQVYNEETDWCHVKSCRTSRFFPDFFMTPDNYQRLHINFLWYKINDKANDFIWGKILFCVLRIYTSLTYVEYRRKPNVLVQVNFACFSRHTVHNDEISKD